MDRHIPLKDIQRSLDDGGDDTWSTWSSEDCKQSAICEFGHDGCDGWHWSFVGPDIIGWRRIVSKHIGDVGYRKVCHFIIHYDSRLWYHDPWAEEDVDSGGHGYCHSRCICSNNVGSTMVLMTLKAIWVILRNIERVFVGYPASSFIGVCLIKHSGFVKGNTIHKVRISQTRSFSVSKPYGFIQSVGA